MLTDEQKLRIACELVREERAKEQVVESTTVPVRGITPAKLLAAVKGVSTTYHARKQGGIKADFEQIIEDTVRVGFTDDRARHIVKHVLGHFFAWRRNKSLPPEAHTVARNLGYSLL